MIKENN